MQHASDLRVLTTREYNPSTTQKQHVRTCVTYSNMYQLHITTPGLASSAGDSAGSPNGEILLNLGTNCCKPRSKTQNKLSTEQDGTAEEPCNHFHEV
jgi:hypothetical protein